MQWFAVFLYLHGFSLDTPAFSTSPEAICPPASRSMTTGINPPPTSDSESDKRMDGWKQVHLTQTTASWLSFINVAAASRTSWSRLCHS